MNRCYSDDVLLFVSSLVVQTPMASVTSQKGESDILWSAIGRGGVPVQEHSTYDVYHNICVR